MKIVGHPVFVLMGTTAALVYGLQRAGVVLPPFIQNHWNDLLVIPMVLWFVLALLTVIRGQQAKVSVALALSITVYYAMYFEWYLPQFHPRYTADVLDVVCYGVGMLFFMWFQPKIKK